MALREIVDDNGRVVVQGFREGGDAPPYVYLQVSSTGDGVGTVLLEPQEADMLAEYLRQEAESARVVQKEEAK